MVKQKSDFICKGEQPHYQGGNSSEQFQLSPTETVREKNVCPINGPTIQVHTDESAIQLWHQNYTCNIRWPVIQMSYIPCIMFCITIKRNLSATLFIPSHTLVSALTRFGVYWWCQKTLNLITAETNTWVGIKSVVLKCWLLHGDIRWLYHFTNWHNITYEKSQKCQASNSKMASERVKSVGWYVKKVTAKKAAKSR